MAASGERAQQENKMLKACIESLLKQMAGI
jgi:hypothetical protein